MRKLWIKTQNEEALYLVDSFVVKGNYSYIITDRNGKIILGQYSTFKKAFEVLNKIEHHLSADISQNIPFQMPKDSEVWK